MKENLRAHKPFMTDIDLKLLPRNIIHPAIIADPFGSVGFILSKLFGDIGTDVTKSFLDRLKFSIKMVVTNTGGTYFCNFV